MDLLQLPVVMLENIVSYLSYDEIAKFRVVSRTFNEVCSRMLNRGFVMIERRHALALKNVKAQLPRRESERRYHPLSRHCDILTSIETRISMLNMTYSKFIDHGLCCFIPGKVIDEIKRVLLIVETSKTPPRAHEVLQELRDISSMAIEHFDDKISPAFRKKLQEGMQPPAPRAPAAALLAPIAIRQELNFLRRRTLLNAKLSTFLATHFKKLHKKMVEYKKLTFKQRKTIRELTKNTQEQDATIADLKKRIEECDIKYSELTHTNQAAGGKAIGAGGEPSTSSQPLRHFGSQIKLDLSVLPIGTSKRTSGGLLPNIKPRNPLIKLPSLSDDTEPPAKIAKIAKTESPIQPILKPNPRTKSISTMAKIRGLTNEIRQLNNLSRTFDKQLKRPLSLTSFKLPDSDCKKVKLD